MKAQGPSQVGMADALPKQNIEHPKRTTPSHRISFMAILLSKK